MSPSPNRKGAFAYTGTAALALFIVQAMSGIVLALSYEPAADRAFASIAAIREEAPFGFFYTTLHAVGAKLFVFAVFLHLFRVLLQRAHRRFRPGKWWLGMLAFVAILLSGLSGNLLPWSQQSYWSCVISTEALRAVPGIGAGLVRAVRGGEMVTGVTLGRFHAVHVYALPVAILVLSFFHARTGGPWPLFWKTAVPRARTAALGLAALFFSVFFAFDAFLRHQVPANPLITPEHIKPEWYFLAPYELLKLIPSGPLALACLLILFLLLFFLPVIDRKGSREWIGGPAYLALTTAGIVGFVVLTIMGWL